MKIGENIDLGVQPLLLAPMEDVTNPSFRWVCKEFEADMMYTEFISPHGRTSSADECCIESGTCEKASCEINRNQGLTRRGD